MKTFNNVQIQALDFEFFPFILFCNESGDNTARSWVFLETVPNDDGSGIKKIKIWDIHTHPKHRRKGYASVLIEDLKTKCDYLETGFFGLNTPGEMLMKKHGFYKKRNMFKKEDKVLIWQKCTKS